MIEERPRSRIVIVSRGKWYIVFYEWYAIKGKQWVPKQELIRAPQGNNETGKQVRAYAIIESLKRNLLLSDIEVR